MNRINAIHHFETFIENRALYHKSVLGPDAWTYTEKTKNLPLWVEKVIIDLKAEIESWSGREVSYAQLVKVERNASGHSDYLRTFAIGCVDLMHAKDA